MNTAVINHSYLSPLKMNTAVINHSYLSPLKCQLSIVWYICVCNLYVCLSVCHTRVGLLYHNQCLFQATFWGGDLLKQALRYGTC